MKDVYEELRKHLNRLPGGFPATESGVEFRILKRLFTPQDAELALHLGLTPQPARVIAEKAGVPEEEMGARLMDMSRRGLVFRLESNGRPTAYMASQFIVGIWEYNVNNLDRDFIRDTDEYMPVLAQEAFGSLPQLRTIPIGKNVQGGLNVLPYEDAETLVRSQKKFLVAPCICRVEHGIKGDACDKPVEACLVFGWGADFYEKNGLGRTIDLEETLKILQEAEKAGLVLQPTNSREITNICCCCGDCCQVLQHLKRQPAPALAAAAPFVVRVDSETCLGCETCLDRCQMEALSMDDGIAVVDENRCIGCGLCVSTCSGEAMTLTRRPEAEQKPVPKDTREAYIMRAQARAEARAEIEARVERHKAVC